MISIDISYIGFSFILFICFWPFRVSFVLYFFFFFFVSQSFILLYLLSLHPFLIFVLTPTHSHPVFISDFGYLPVCISLFKGVCLLSGLPLFSFSLFPFPIPLFILSVSFNPFQKIFFSLFFFLFLSLSVFILSFLCFFFFFSPSLSSSSTKP